MTWHVVTHATGNDACCSDDADYRMWLRTLGQVCSRFEWVVHAWCMLSTHYHGVFETPQANLAQGMEQLNGRYARRHNERHDRRGHLFRARYYAGLIESDVHFLESCRYVELNAKRAGLCEHAAEWPWSSYRPRTGLQPRPPFLGSGRLLGYFGDDQARALVRYREFIDEFAA